MHRMRPFSFPAANRYAAVLLPIIVFALGLVSAPPQAQAACTSQVTSDINGALEYGPYTDEKGEPCTPTLSEQAAAAKAGKDKIDEATSGKAAEQKTPPTPTSCTSWWSLFNPVCIGRAIGSFAAALLMKLAVWTLTTVGTLFNSLLDYTVVQFANKIYEFTQAGIENAWRVFRDVSNIIIIGMFTFIAIEMILGNETYGTKKLVAKVLIIAILINFSLLFTKIIVDTSNFSAKLFYDAASKIAPAAAGKATIGGSAAEAAGATGIAGGFIAYMGVAGFGDTYDTIRALAERQNNGVLAFLYGLFSATLILAVAGVLLYGGLLLVGRAVMLLVLMMLSSLAFASYLVPNIAEGQWGWSAWWSQLIKNGLFAPLLTMFLWGTLIVAKALASAPGGGTLGQLISDPTKPVGIAAFINYLIVLGLLYASIRIASSFSTSGAHWLARATIGTAAAATFGAAGLAARFTFGAGAARLLATERVAKMGEAPGVRGFAGRMVQSTLKNFATASYDARGVPGAARGSKLLGLDFGKPKGEGGYIKSFDDRKKRIEKNEAELAALIGRETGADIRAGAKTNQQIETENAAIAEKEEQKDEAFGALRAELEEVLKNPQAANAIGNVDQLANAMEKLQQTTEKASQQQTSALQNATIQATVQATPEQESAKSESNMSQQRHRIEEAQKEAKERLQKELAGLPEDVRKRFLDKVEGHLKTIEEADEAIAARQKNIDKLTSRMSPLDRTQAYLNRLGNKRYLTIGLGLTTTFSPDIKKKVEQQVKMPATEKLIRDLIKGNEDTKKTADAAKAAAERAGQAAKPAS